MFLSISQQKIMIKMSREKTITRKEQKVYSTDHSFFSAMRPLRDLGLVDVKRVDGTNYYSLSEKPFSTEMDGVSFVETLVKMHEEY